MNFRWAIIPVILLLATVLQAQGKNSYRSYNYIGLLQGEDKVKYQFMTIHGLQHKSWFAGIGTGIDNYGITTVPVFVSVNKYVLPKNNMFVSLNMGTSFVWKDDYHFLSLNSVESDFKPRLFWEAGFGYRLNVGKPGQGILLGIYHSYKQIREVYSYSQGCPYGNCPDDKDVFTATYRRIALKLGFVF